MSSSTPSRTPSAKTQRTTSGSATASAASAASKWGSFFQGAVAGLESRLDTILAEDGDTAVNRGATVQERRDDVAGGRKGLGSNPTSASVSRSGSFRSDEKGLQQGWSFLPFSTGIFLVRVIITEVIIADLLLFYAGSFVEEPHYK